MAIPVLYLPQGVQKIVQLIGPVHHAALVDHEVAEGIACFLGPAGPQLNFLLRVELVALASTTNVLPLLVWMRKSGQ
jgi:hypothetical protein